MTTVELDMCGILHKLEYNNTISSKCFTAFKYITVNNEVVDLRSKSLIKHPFHTAKHNYYIDTSIVKLNHIENFTMADQSFNGQQYWYNIKLNQKEWRTLAITKPDNFNGKYLINFDFTTGYNTGSGEGDFPCNSNPIDIFSHLNKPYGYKSQNGKKYGLGGLETLNMDPTVLKNDKPVYLQLQLFTKLLNDGVTIIHFTQSSWDTVVFAEGICDYSCNTTDYNRLCSTPSRTVRDELTGSGSDGAQCWTLGDNSCSSVVSSCNDVADVHWNLSGNKISNDRKYFHIIMQYLQNNPNSFDLSGLQLERGGIYGWSIGAQAVSRYMNEFSNHNWPRPLFGIFGAGGSLHCYEGSMGIAWSDPSRNPTSYDIGLGFCPYVPSSEHADYLYKKKKLALEPFYDICANNWKNHPPVFGFQSYSDNWADRWAVRSYINTLQYQLKRNNLSNTPAYTDSSYIMASGDIHGMSTSEQMLGAYTFAKKLYA